jgi:arylsulfatase A-like enzyme
LDEHDRAYYDEWDKALQSRGLVKPSRYTRFQRNPSEYREALGCFVWDLDDGMHPDFFVGDNALWWLKDRKSEAPLFLQIGFPGPHPPYDPVRRYLDLYEHVDIPVPQTAPDLSKQPAAQAQLRENMIEFNFDSVAWRSELRSADLLRLRRYYAANVTMIDEKVGALVEVLRRRGYLENAILIFTSDHGDALGDHAHIQKWTMYDSVTRVPLIVCGTDVPQEARRDQLVQLMDLAPTILDYAGIAVPGGWEAHSLRDTIENNAPAREVVHAELGRDHIQTGAEYIVMRRDSRWKLVWYLGADDGELYDLHEDPKEECNLWFSQEHLALRDRLVSETKDWSIRGVMKSKNLPTRKPQQPMSIDKHEAT